MKLKKYVKTVLLSSILATGLSVFTLETGLSDYGMVKVYAKKTSVKNKVKKDKKVLKDFKPVIEQGGSLWTDLYTDSKNNKIYISIEDFFSELEGTTK